MAAAVGAGGASAQVFTMGDLYVVQDPSGAITNLTSMMNMTIFPSPQEQFCRAAFNAVRMSGAPDQYDGIFAFSTADNTINDINDVWQGTPIRSDAQGIGRDPPFLTTSSYMSNRLGQCVFMGTLGHTMSFLGGTGSEPIPPDPDSEWSPSLGIPIPFKSLTGIEMFGHEYGHHWLMGIQHDENNGMGMQAFIRGFGDKSENGDMGKPNQHYSDYADSRSVMYGECITPLDGGSYQFAGCKRRYSDIDQYLMGLRAACEVRPMMVLTDPAAPNEGVDSLPMSASAMPITRSGLQRHDIGAPEVIRAMGVRSPAYPAANRCWRVAFVVVLAPGQNSIPVDMYNKVIKYQQRWPGWFFEATDGRGSMVTSLTGPGCPEQDGGPVFDPICPVDGGMQDAGMELEDAGIDDAGREEPDAGTEPDAGEMPMGHDAGTDDISKLRPGCGCGAADGAAWVLLTAALVLRPRRRIA